MFPLWCELKSQLDSPELSTMQIKKIDPPHLTSN